MIAALFLLVLSACGRRQNAASEPSPTGQSTSPTNSTTTTTGPSSSALDSESAPPNVDNPCTSESLAGYVEPRDAAAGTRSVVLVVKNTSRQACSLEGFGGLELLSATKQPIPTNAERTLDPRPTLVTLSPGAEAGKILNWVVVATGDEPTTGPCHPAAAAINVKPPDETVPFEVKYTFGSVCDQGKFDTSAYFAR